MSASQLPAGERRAQLQERLSGGLRPSQLPERNFDQVRQGWSDRRDEIRNDWQDYRDEARDDLQEWREDQYPWHGGWYWGNAGGYWGWWDHMWDEHPVAATVGLTWWGANRLGYAFGCGADYSNPYYSDSAGYNYSDPIVETYAEPAAETQRPSIPTEQALDVFSQAQTAFYSGSYEEALQFVDTAAEQMPKDAVLHEFRSLVLFALKRYRDSAAAIHAVLAVGPGWDWKTLSSLYPSVDTYTTQLRALEKYQELNPNAADAHFLLAYHYLTCGSNEAALTQFRRASELQPNDSVSANLVQSLTPRDATVESESVSNSDSKPIPPADLIGTWSATGKGNSKFTMTLDQEGNFNWLYTEGAKSQGMRGVYSVEGNVLAMQPESGGVLVAELDQQDANHIRFQMVGSENNAPDLNFVKEQ